MTALQIAVCLTGTLVALVIAAFAPGRRGQVFWLAVASLFWVLPDFWQAWELAA